MSTNRLILVFFFFCIGFVATAQKARIRGIVLSSNNQPIDNVNVVCLGNSTQSNANGFFDLAVPANQQVIVIFTHVSLKKTTVSILLKPNEDYEMNLVMNDYQEQMGEVIVISNNKKRVQGITTIEPEVILPIPIGFPSNHKFLLPPCLQLRHPDHFEHDSVVFQFL